MTTFHASDRRASSHLVALIVFAVIVVLIGAALAFGASKVNGMVEDRNDRITQQIEDLG